MPETTQEEVEITALIRGILNGYPGNSAILREYLQNSDDAKASKQLFILDERKHPSECIIDPALKEAQGPALIAYNDGVLRPNDWKALRTIHSSSKQADDGQTGRNGLGFRASYHLTDNPHVLSCQTLMILDPHRAFVEHPGGASINIVHEGTTYKDQLTAFNSVLQDDAVPFFGTAFRLPFRTTHQAIRSKISDKVTHVGEFQEMLRNFVSNELESVILFLKHITSIEVRCIDPQGTVLVLGKVEIDGLDPTPHSGKVHRKVTLSTENGTSSTRTWCFHTHRTEREEAAQIMSSRLGYDIGDRLVLEKLVPGINIAFPLEGPNVKGGLFTLLPLPVNIPGSAFHVNAVFALTPDRQNLKKKQEVGDIHSRERFLVQWNTVVLDEWAPVAWVEALNALDPKNLLQRGWSVWPPEERDPDSYWFCLAHEVTKQIVEHDLPIFPSHDLQYLVSHHAALFAHPTDDQQLLFAILSRFDLHIVQPPPQIFSALEGVANNFQASVLSPCSLHNKLCNDIAKTSGLPLDVKAAHKVMEYLALTSSPPTFHLLSDLPWFSRTDGSFVSLTSPPTPTRWIIPATEEEAELFANDPRMLSWGCVSDDLHFHLLKIETAKVLNVTTMNVQVVSAFLDSEFSALDRLSDELPDVDKHHVDWLLWFWTWFAKWSAREQFFKTEMGKIQHLHLLPTSHKTIRKMSSQIITFQNVPQATVGAWGALGVHGLHDSIPRDAVSILKEKAFAVAQGASGFVSLIIKTYDMDRQPLLNQTSFIHIRNSLTLGLHPEAEPEFSPQEKEKLLRLQVFMVRHHPGERSIFGPASGTPKFLKVPDHFPLPRLESDNAVYIDMRDFATERLIKLVNRNRLDVLHELDVLKLAIHHWDLQPMDFQDRIIEKIFESRRHISALRESLKSLKFVTVNQIDHRVQPRGLIHPLSQLAGLYKGEPGRIPTGRFSSPDYLIFMQTEGFLDHSLNESIVQERLDYFKSASSHEKSIACKATAFVQLLNKFWEPSYKPFILRERSTEWFPCNGLSLAAPHQCRDSHRSPHEHPYYYDLCLRVLDGDVVSVPGLRSALGWLDAIPSHVLVEQLRLTLELGTNRNDERLIKLLNYLGQLRSDGTLTIAVVENLKEVVGAQPWIPVMAGPTESLNLATSKHAVLSESELKLPFRRVNPRFKHLPFLLEMGCTIRPTFETLVEELTKCDIISVGRILEEIALHHTDFDRNLVTVPDVRGRMCPIDNVYYRDINVIDFAGEISQKSPLHNVILPSLAEALGIPFASSLALGEDDDDDEQMSEDLVGRIRGFLTEYDSRYAMNEFLANADDAGATEFSILLDGGDPRDKSKQHFIAPAFESVQGSPSLVLYNNATLSDEDFKGLVRVGRGGKVELSETHGRHGLGALSFYYFTDVVTVISRDTLLILDPSSKYLPQKWHGQKRTSLRKKFGDVARAYPDQLKSYGDLGFSPSAPYFSGTIFILPLTSSITQRPSDVASTIELMRGYYHELSQNAFFFTKLEKISASFLARNVFKYLWRLSATRSPILTSQNSLSRCILDVDGTKEDWLIATSDKTPIPSLHDATALGLKLLPQSPMKVQLAIKTSLSSTEEPESYLFSTFRLPKTTSLPFHLHSRFAISSNRQSIVFDPADSRNSRDSKTSFNIWILENLVPPLYLSALEHILHSSTNSLSRRFDSKGWWLSHRPDGISAVVGTAFCELLPKADNLLFKSVDGRWISFRDSVFSGNETSPIRDILRSLKVPGFVCSYRHSGLTKISSAKVLDTNFMKQVLLNDETWRIFLTSCCREKTISVIHIWSILEYVAKDPPLVGLPLLILSSRTLRVVRIPGAQTSTIYVSPHPSAAALFSSSLFLEQGYSKEVVRRLQVDSSIRVVGLSDGNITTLIKTEICRFTTDEERNIWLDLFWDHYSSLPTPENLEFLEDATLKIIKTSTENLSLPECLSNRVIYDMAAVKNNGLESITKNLGMVVLAVDSKSIIGKHLSKRFPDKLIVNFLLCLQEQSVTSFDFLTTTEHDRLATWLRENIYQNIWIWCSQDPGIRRSFLLQLPLWKVYRDQGGHRRAATGVTVLPSNFPAENLISYLKPARSIASHSLELVKFLEYCRYLKPGSFICMSARDIMNAVSFPTTLETPADFNRLKRFVWSILRLPTTELKLASLKLPVSDGTLRDVNELYDHTVSLFEKTLKYTQCPSFLHDQFRNFNLPTLRCLGMTYEIDLASFRFCASEVQRLSDQSQRRGSGNWPNQQEVFEMSRYAFETYQVVLPRQLMTNKRQWTSLDKIAFIRAKEVRRQGLSYDWRRYFAPLSAVLAPSQLVRPSLQSIAWTQRPLCFYEPTDELLAVNATFGVPQVSEVVEHLKFLTTRIAQDHPGDRTLLSDIQATYKWLDDHAEEAKVPLSSARHLKLFLNVNDPTQDEWTGQWETAQDIVLNLHYDYPNLKTARGFLLKYDKLLRAAGCRTIKIMDGDVHEPGPSRPASDNQLSREAQKEDGGCSPTTIFEPDGREPGPSRSESDYQRSREAQNEMRKAGVLTDMIFVPTSRPYEISIGADNDYGGGCSSIGEGASECNDGADGIESDSNILEEVDVDSSELRAHRLVLAATIPYIRDLATGWKLNNTVAVIPFYGSAFGAKMLLDYVYIGEFDFSDGLPVTMDEVARLLKDFLELMQIADEWNMQTLKETLEWNIVDKFDLVQRLPHANKMMLEEAEKYNAKKLKKALVEFAKHNKTVLEILQGDEQIQG